MHFSPVIRAAGVLGLLITLPGCNRDSSQSGPAPAAPVAPAPPAAPVEKPGPRVYVSDETGGRVIVIDPESRAIVRTINVGKRPRGLRVSSDGTKLYVALSGSPIAGPNVDESKLPPADKAADGIGVVDLATGAVVRKYQSGSDPESFSMSRDGRLLFVSNEDTGEMSVLDLESGDVKARVKIGEEPEGVTTAPDGATVYVSCEGTNEVVAVSTVDYKVVGRSPTGPRPRSLAFTADGATGFVANENNASLTVFIARTRKVLKTIRLPKPAGADAIPPRPMGLQLGPDGATLFVTLGRAKSIGLIDTATLALKQIISDVGGRPWGIGINDGGTTLYTANGPSGDVSIVDVASGATQAKIHVGGSPWGIATSRSSR